MTIYHASSGQILNDLTFVIDGGQKPPSGGLPRHRQLNGMSRQLLPVLILLLFAWTTASAKGTGYAFVSNEKTNNIVVLDPKHDYRVVTSISTSHRPRGMAFRNDRERLLVACGDDNVIDVIDVTTLEVTDHIPTDPNPEVFELSRDEKTLYVPNKVRSAVQQIGVEDKFIEHEIRTGAEPGEVVESSDSKILYVISELGNWVHVVDLASGAVTDNIVVGTKPETPLLIPGEKELWVSSDLSGHGLDHRSCDQPGYGEFGRPAAEVSLGGRGARGPDDDQRRPNRVRYASSD